MIFCIVFGNDEITKTQEVVKSSDNKCSTLRIFHVNIRSLKPHLDKLEALILSLESPPDIICLSETWLCESDNYAGLLINGYNQFCAKNRQGTIGGGVMIQVKSNCTLLRELETQFDEAILAEIAINNYRVKIAVIYNKPRTNKNLFNDTLDTFLEASTDKNVPMIVCGDFNINTIEE